MSQATFDKLILFPN